MAQNSVIKFYRGLTDAALPSQKDGTIFIVANDPALKMNLNEEDKKGMIFRGDMYVDIDDATRLQIKPDDAIYTMTNQERISSGDPAVPGRVYYIPDYQSYTYTAVVDGKTKTIEGNKPGVIVGDSGGACIRDLPVFSVLTSDQIEKWDSKITAYAVKISFENNQASDGNDYDLHLSLEDINPRQPSKN